MTSTEEIPVDMVPVTALQGNYPNPFNPETRISFSLGKESNVRVDVFNIKGQLVKNLLEERMVSGEHILLWDGTDDQGRVVGSGLYFYRLQTEDYSSTRKMMLLK
jgi:flagellar hook assembly protein FlgD